MSNVAQGYTQVNPVAGPGETREPPEPRTHQGSRCEVPRCKEREPGAYPGHGTFCPRHARLMIPRSRWALLSVPVAARATARGKNRDAA